LIKVGYIKGILGMQVNNRGQKNANISMILNMSDAVLFSMYREFPGLSLLAVCIGMPGVIDSKNRVIIESVPFLLWNYSLCLVFRILYQEDYNE
jgi:hypothetical protein